MNTPATPEALPREVVNRLLAIAQHSPDHEVCGLVGGDGTHYRHVYPVVNAAREPAHLFDMDGAALIEAQRALREQGDRLMAVFHSHPGTDAQPTTTDIAGDTYPELLYLIIALGTQGVLELRGFRWRAGGLVEVPLALAGH
jgi:proteasome lid subunit RPN8/RPN11